VLEAFIGFLQRARSWNTGVDGGRGEEERERERDGGYRARGTRGAVKLSVSSGIEEKEGERRREGERGGRERVARWGWSVWLILGDAARGRGCPGFRVREDPPIELQDRPRSPWQPRGSTGGDYETGVTRLSTWRCSRRRHPGTWDGFRGRRGTE